MTTEKEIVTTSKWGSSKEVRDGGGVRQPLAATSFQENKNRFGPNINRKKTGLRNWRR